LGFAAKILTVPDNKYEFPTVSFGSELVRRAFALERLRGDFGMGTTPSAILIELHNLFQLLMSVISARIEGNRTTVYDALRTIPDSGQPVGSESQQEIQNILAAMTFIDGTDAEEPLSHVFIRELHRISVQGLVREGDPNPGNYRRVDVGISRSNHHPPSHLFVQPEMDEFLAFANRPTETSEQMMHVAMAHHRFLWIHPFQNGNGRVSRLMSYAMLRRHGFVSPVGLRTVNPTAVFGNDRDEYYSALSTADDLSNAGTVEWCTFFVRGIHIDMERLTRLQDAEFVNSQLFAPALDRMVRAGIASRAERDAMATTLREVVVKAGDLSVALPGTPSSRSVAIHGMLERGLLTQAPQGPRFYRVPLRRAPLGPFLVQQLDALGYLPPILQGDAS
jgi:Fic family protein